MVKIVISIQNGLISSVVANTEMEVLVRRPLVTQDITFEHECVRLTGADGEEYEVYRLKPWINAKGTAYMHEELERAEAR